VKVFSSFKSVTWLVALASLLLSMSVHAQTSGARPLSNIPVAGTVVEGGAFEGILSITQLGLDSAGQLVASGVLRGTANGQRVNQEFTGVPIALQQQQPGVCDILFLDLGPLHLDILGLTIDLSRITLDINAVPGPGNLLGNLLCALVGLLDNIGLGGTLQAVLLDLLNAINLLL
jgi:hypothetical protein